MKVSSCTRNRTYFFFLLIAGALLLFMLRIGYMQFIYKQDMVTFAQINQTVEDLNAPIVEEVINSFEVDLTAFQEIKMEELTLDGKPDVTTLSLIDLVTDSCQDGCTGRPAIFVQEDLGYIFYKEVSGENVLLEINKNNEKWLIAKIQRES